jgi:hypothetical protein
MSSHSEEHQDLKIPESRFPELPPELERDIFELTAMTQHGTAVKLATLAQRTQIWCVLIKLYQFY